VPDRRCPLVENHVNSPELTQIRTFIYLDVDRWHPVKFLLLDSLQTSSTTLDHLLYTCQLPSKLPYLPSGDLVAHNGCGKELNDGVPGSTTINALKLRLL
jgi:hypothetical protein